MSWVSIDDNAPDHRKQIAAGPLACWLWTCGLCYCNRQPARDGFIPEGKVTVLYPLPQAKKLADKLVEVGLWKRVAGGYLVHDYHDYQLDRDELKERRERVSEARQKAGRAGGVASGASRREKSAQSFEVYDADARKRASSLVNLALKRGELQRQPCIECGEPETQGHHDDYGQPLVVRWLCKRHHEDVHVAIRAEANEAIASSNGPAKRSPLLSPPNLNKTSKASSVLALLNTRVREGA
jgi:hypothetical protein